MVDLGAAAVAVETRGIRMVVVMGVSQMLHKSQKLMN
jgi:hypothetical protein